MSGIKPQADLKDSKSLDAGTSIASAALTEWPNQDWWTIYQDPQLDSLVAKSITDSPTLKVANSRVALSQAYADSMHAETLPDLSLGGSISRERFTAEQFIPPPWAGSVSWNNSVTAKANYDLDLWDKQKNIWNAALDEKQATAIEAQQVKLELESALVRTYIQLQLQYNLRDVAQEDFGQINQRIAIARRALEAGIGTQMELSETETPLPLARARIEAIDGHISLLKNQLAALTGQGPGFGDSITRPTLVLDAPIGLPDNLPANLIGRRPDVLANRFHVEAAAKNIQGAKAAFYPNINLLAFIGFQALSFSNLLTSAASIAVVGPAISLPFFDGGRRRSNLSGKTAIYDIAVENYNTVIVTALQDVSDQLVIMQATQQQLNEAKQALATADKSFQLSLKSYHAGLSNYQHVLELHQVLLQQKVTMIQLQATRLDAYAGLMRALGGGILDKIIQSGQAKP
jgi:NodT family efflux transporter outer membrane factor (OMF) lipoprotein